MTNLEHDVLSHFSFFPDLITRLEKTQTKNAFCELIQRLHDIGVDLWIPKSGQIHGGRTEHFQVWQSNMVLRIELQSTLIRVALNIEGNEPWQELTGAVIDTLVLAMQEQAKLLSLSGRLPYWPDDYAIMVDKLIIKMTNGAIRNGYLTIPASQNIFPDECIEQEHQPAQQLFTLLLPNGEQIQTKVLAKFKRIQARFNALFAKFGLKEGDRIQLMQQGPYIYQMTFLQRNTSVQPETNSVIPKTTQEVKMIRSPLNQILFGPPGTGKTFNTINKALEILDPEFLNLNADDSYESRLALKSRFDALVKEKRIDFVTFHQSFSYEDFVEGIRAISNEESQLEYRIEPGIFKRISDEARASVSSSSSGIRSKPRIWKISINGTADSPTRRYCLENGEIRIGWGHIGDLRLSLDNNESYQKIGSNDRSTLNCFANEIAIGDIVICIRSIEQIEAVGVVNGDYRYEQDVPDSLRDDYQHVRPVNWLYRDVGLSILPLNDDTQFTLKTVYAMDRFSWADLLAYLQQHGKVTNEIIVPQLSKRPYVLVIDEINRGNISRIFGELITLIEPSKRYGADEALSTILPYSKKPFSVPDNLYLIGTMNTADRSLAGLDIALRRRFTFIEMQPKPELLDDVYVEDINIGALLRVMNQRIEVLLDRDHCLGHAYFLPLKEKPTRDQLASIFRNQILPLLQEYFFEDWQRINWVLNGHQGNTTTPRFIHQPESNTELARLFGDELSGQLQDRRWHLEETAFDNIESYRQILKGTE